MFSLHLEKGREGWREERTLPHPLPLLLEKLQKGLSPTQNSNRKGFFVFLFFSHNNNSGATPSNSDSRGSRQTSAQEAEGEEPRGCLPAGSGQSLGRPLPPLGRPLPPLGQAGHLLAVPWGCAQAPAEQAGSEALPQPLGSPALAAAAIPAPLVWTFRLST